MAKKRQSGVKFTGYIILVLLIVIMIVIVSCTGNSSGVNRSTNCTKTYMPVCSGSGIIYRNECFALKAGATIAHVGECSSRAVDIVDKKIVLYDNRSADLSIGTFIVKKEAVISITNLKAGAVNIVSEDLNIFVPVASQATSYVRFVPKKEGSYVLLATDEYVATLTVHSP